jgi:hypothetical protein
MIQIVSSVLGIVQSLMKTIIFEGNFEDSIVTSLDDNTSVINI